jgi:hypothetical protein
LTPLIPLTISSDEMRGSLTKIIRRIRATRLENGCSERFVRNIGNAAKLGVSQQRAISTDVNRSSGIHKMVRNSNARAFATPPVQENQKFVVNLQRVSSSDPFKVPQYLLQSTMHSQTKQWRLF